jgi:hypothetical protein
MHSHRLCQHYTRPQQDQRRCVSQCHEPCPYTLNSPPTAGAATNSPQQPVQHCPAPPATAAVHLVQHKH